MGKRDRKDIEDAIDRLSGDSSTVELLDPEQEPMYGPDRELVGTADIESLPDILVVIEDDENPNGFIVRGINYGKHLAECWSEFHDSADYDRVMGRETDDADADDADAVD